jgi:uncharacterized protein (TIGR03437 family)
MRPIANASGTPSRLSLSLFVLTLSVALPISARSQSLSWVRQFGSAAADRLNALAADGTGIYAVGSVDATLPGQSSAGNQDCFVRKYDASGTELWTRQFGGTANEGAQGVVVDASGIYVSGTTGGELPGQTTAGMNDAFLRKYDTAGNVLWTRQFGTSAADFGSSVAADSSGVYVFGSTFGTFPGQANAGDDDVFVRKYDTAGNVLWTRQFGSPENDDPINAVADATGLYVGGTARAALPGQSYAGIDDGFVRKYDASGNVLWTDQFGTAGQEGVLGMAIDSTGIYAGGITTGVLPGQTGAGSSDGFVRKYDAAGSVLWTRQYGTATGEGVNEMAADSTGVYVTGNSFGALGGPNAGGSDVYARKFDVSGNVVWTFQFGSSASDFPFGLAASAGSVYVAGYTEGTLAGQTSAGGTADDFVVKLTQPLTTILLGGVVSAASFAAHPAPLAPGTIATIFGSSLTDGSSVLNTSFGSDGRLVTTLGGTQVRVNGVLAPMFFATPGQLAIQIPVEVAGQTSASLQVIAAGQPSDPRTIFIDSATPGVFTANQSGAGPGAITHVNGSAVSQQNPARPDEILVLYATGFGALNPPLATGAPSAGNTTAVAATVTVDGVPATVLFSGTTPGLVGLNQINLRVPASTRAANNIPVVVTIGGKQSNTVTIAVAP